MKKEDLHIAILKFGRDKLEEGVTFDEFKKHVRAGGYDVSKDRLESYFWGNYEPLDRLERGRPQEATNRGSKFSLTVESTFRLIEFEEFQSANRSSRIATWFATAALVVSIIAAGTSIYFSMKQLESASEIDQEEKEDEKGTGVSVNISPRPRK